VRGSRPRRGRTRIATENFKEKFSMSIRSAALTAAGFCGLALSLPAVTGAATAPHAGRVVTESVHGASLERTVTGESADRSVTIYLPPGYDDSRKRYPVVYLLHGIGGTDTEWVEEKEPWQSIQSVMDNGIAAGLLQEMIVVMPNEQTKRYGSYYTNSSVTGRWEDFTTRELVSHVDRTYRTLADRSSRGIAGHSMGGYGALRLGMKYPDTYSVVYAMNPSLVGWAGDLTALNPAYLDAARARSDEDEQVRPPNYAAGIMCVAQAFSPNPQRPPFYVDLPYREENGVAVPAEPGFSAWEANFIENMVPKYSANLRRLRGLRFDSGYEDQFQYIPPNSRALSLKLTTYGIDHVFEEYNGDHRNRLWGPNGRIYTEVLPYFSRLLDASTQGKAR
jgi:enterochelin esterase-like enzyme